MPGYSHMLLRILPKDWVSQVVGYIKGKIAIHPARLYGEKKLDFVGQHLWMRGYYVSTVGWDEDVIWASIQNLGEEDRQLEQLQLL